MTIRETYEYALKHGPENKTRKIVCQDPEFAYKYAENVDKCFRRDTREAV